MQTNISETQHKTQTMKKYLPHLPALLLSIGGLLRIVTVGAAAIWFDECITMIRTRLPFLQLFSDTRTWENSGDLFLDVIERPLMAIGQNVILLRLPSLLAGLISLWLVWKIMQRLGFTPLQQVITSALVAFLPGLLWIGQDARSYSIVGMFFLAGLWFTLEAGWLGMLACCGLLYYCHYTAAALAAALLAISLLLRPYAWRRTVLIGAVVVASWLPGIYRMLSHWIIQQPWEPTVTIKSFLMGLTMATWTHQISNSAMVFAFMGVGFLTLFFLVDRRMIMPFSRSVPMLAWGVPMGLQICFSLVTHNNFVMYRTLQPLLWGAMLWLGWELGRPGWFRRTLLVGWTFLLAAGLITWHPSQRGAGVDKVAAQIRAQWRAGDELVYTTGTVLLPFDYYLHDLPSEYLENGNQWVNLAFPSNLLPPRPLEGPVLRRWVIVPQEPLLSDAEEQAIRDYVGDHEPVISIIPLQVAPMDVYLLEE